MSVLNFTVITLSISSSFENRIQNAQSTLIHKVFTSALRSLLIQCPILNSFLNYLNFIRLLEVMAAFEGIFDVFDNKFLSESNHEELKKRE